jgi:hypothetical protein
MTTQSDSEIIIKKLMLYLNSSLIEYKIAPDKNQYIGYFTLSILNKLADLIFLEFFFYSLI